MLYLPGLDFGALGITMPNNQAEYVIDKQKTELTGETMGTLNHHAVIRQNKTHRLDNDKMKSTIYQQPLF
jgi:hypothetical protein